MGSRFTMVVASLVAAASLALFPSAAFGFAQMNVETGTVDVSRWDGTNNCVNCHGTTPFGVFDKGPHGTYGGTLKRCNVCHEVHVAGGSKLLPAATVKGTCEVCHDGTGGFGVYGTVAARGLAVAASHRIDLGNQVPGGDASTGGSSTVSFVGENQYLGCDDCHSPHDTNTITSFFRSDRVRNNLTENVGTTSHLLKQRPTGASTTTTVYGSNWCAGCHKGRRSGGSVHNHPVDETFDYSNVPVLASDDPTGTTVMGTMGRNNRGYLMPFPRTAEQAGHAPICQQCHEDARNAGVLNGATADVATFTITSVDGTSSADNPRFQTFPHESQSARFLVEQNDDLCTNCHPPSSLP